MRGKRCNLCQARMERNDPASRCEMCRNLYSGRTLHIGRGDDQDIVAKTVRGMQAAIEAEHPGLLRRLDLVAARARRARHG